MSQNKEYTFTANQLKAWAEKQLEFNNPNWEKSEDARLGYEKAMRHLIYYVENPIQEII